MAEGKKRNRTPAIKRDPLIDALIRKLPPEGATWPVEQRQAWLRMATQAFDVAYGVQPEIHVSLNSADDKNVRENPARSIEVTYMTGETNITPLRRPTADEIASLDEPRYFIDKDGFARGPGNQRIKPTEVPSDAIIEDERGPKADLDSIIWADGTWPGVALPSLNIQAA